MVKKNTPENNPDKMEQAKILIIDDERSLRKSIKTILEKAGFYCETAFDYSTAQKAVENLQFDLILADIVLPEINGLQLIAKLQKEFKITSAIIFVTGEPSLETATQAIQLGASNYLEKPTSRSVLVEAIKHALLRKNHEISIMENQTPKAISLNEAFLKMEKYDMHEELKEEFQENVDGMHDALLELKKKYGNEFNDDQRNLLNTIAQCNGNLKKILKKIDE